MIDDHSEQYEHFRKSDEELKVRGPLPRHSRLRRAATTPRARIDPDPFLLRRR